MEFFNKHLILRKLFKVYFYKMKNLKLVSQYTFWLLSQKAIFLKCTFSFVLILGKFKGGAKNLEKDFRSFMNPTELLELLRSHDYSGVVNHCKGKVISDADLKMLLDRSDLLEESSGKKLIKKVKIKSKVFEIIDVDEGSKVLLS